MPSQNESYFFGRFLLAAGAAVIAYFLLGLTEIFASNLGFHLAAAGVIGVLFYIFEFRVIRWIFEFWDHWW